MTFEEANRRYQKAMECHRGLNGAFGIHLSGTNDNVCDSCVWKGECSVNSLSQTTFRNLKVQRVIDSCLFHSDSSTEDENLFHRLNDAYKACVKIHDETCKEFDIILEPLKINSDWTGYVKDKICKKCSNMDICNMYHNSNVSKVIVSCRHFDCSDEDIPSEQSNEDSV